MRLRVFDVIRPWALKLLACAALLTAAWDVAPAPAQPGQQSQQANPLPNQPVGSRPLAPGLPTSNEDDPLLRHMTQQLAKSRNNQRQQQLVADSAKLLELATELKAEVDKSNASTLSITVVKKAEEIEKLAKSVKDKMRDGQ